jgi:hypothetical protein
VPAKKTTSSKPKSFSAARNRGRAAGYRSGLEETIAQQLAAYGVSSEYESMVIRYTKPESSHRYTPDFPLPNGIIIETKGRFLPADRQKHLLVRAQHPEKDIRFVFTRSKTPISKGSKTTYADWCEKNGFLYADKTVPEAWLREPRKEL